MLQTSKYICIRDFKHFKERKIYDVAIVSTQQQVSDYDYYEINTALVDDFYFCLSISDVYDTYNYDGYFFQYFEDLKKSRKEKLDKINSL